MSNVTAGRNPRRRRRSDWDGAWKEALQQFFRPFLDLLFPDIHALVDWTHEPVFLEQELRQVIRRTKRQKRAVDKLARVWLMDGNQTVLLIHVEFQHQVEHDLPARLYNYNTRIYALLQEHVMTAAVLGDNDPRWRPSEFRFEIGGFESRTTFPIAKLLDYEPQWEMLEQSSNPFAVIVMAHLKALATMKQPETRLEWRVRLATSLYERGYSEGQVLQLVNFIDWLMVLDDEREERFDETMRIYEAEHTMETLSPYQKRFIARGKLEGKLEGKREDLLIFLGARFEQAPEDIVVAVNRIESPDLLTRLLIAAGQVATLGDFRDLLTSG